KDEWQGEMPQQNHQRHVLPAATEPAVEKRNLFRKVSRPNDQELRKREVRPQHHERQQQLSEIEEMQPGIQIGGERFDVAPGREYRNRQRESGESLTSDENEPEDRRIPGRIERHDP